MSLVKLPKVSAFPSMVVPGDGSTFSLAVQAQVLVLVDLVVLGIFLTVSGLTLISALSLFVATGFAIGASYLGRPRLALSALDDLPQLAARVVLASAIVAGIAALFGRLDAAVDVPLVGTVAIIPLFISRSLMYSGLRRARHCAVARDQAVIVGSGSVADYIHERLRSQPEFGLQVIGYADNDSQTEAVDGLAKISSLAGFPEALSGYGVSTVVFAYSRQREADLLPYVRTTAAAGYRTYVVPRFFEATNRSSATDSVWGLPLVHVKAPRRGMQRLFKRGLDIFVSATALLVLAPLLTIIALTLPRETKASMLFRQQRIGEGGRTFELLKFQTMSPERPTDGDTTWNIANDDRLGKFGRFLRGTSLDELPQFWNVLRGDMSLVGPRPERPHFVDQFSKELPHYADRHRVPVGLTGWAQIHRLRGDTSIDDRARFDNIYCDNWSVWEDIKIICRTVPEVLRSAGR
jgi:exopolysaccharide biosynthesis polyprenyl glycosylphosphotransferase